MTDVPGMELTCGRCGRVIGTSGSCVDPEPIVIRRLDGVVAGYELIPFGAEVVDDPRPGRPLPARCHDCGVVPGGLHHVACGVQQCPACHGQLMNCMCIHEGDEDWDPAWSPAGGGDKDPWDAYEPLPGEDLAHPCPKCGAVPFAPGDGSGRVCRSCNWSWMIGIAGGRYVEP